MYPDDGFFPSGLQAPSFDLGIGYTQATQPEGMKFEELQRQADSVISNVLKETESAVNEVSILSVMLEIMHISPI
jgi:hypothetical protein